MFFPQIHSRLGLPDPSFLSITLIYLNYGMSPDAQPVPLALPALWAYANNRHRSHGLFPSEGARNAYTHLVSPLCVDWI